MLVLFYGFFIFLVLFLVISFFSGSFFNKSDRVSGSWASPYECGFASNSLSFNCFSFTYFSLLVFFVVFDLEISLLLNLPEQGILFNNFFYYFCFLLILCFGFITEIIMGYVRWGY
uniref:NADH-ubiquinone oxidoreductase chain 3 n=2 Tax=unclassified Anthocephalum TaxID=2640108 RepID=A0A8K1SX30_9CEST|nr:NADH dehydrogenase subunit 3 [Anthocephalum sp. LRP 10373]UFQ88283.1 NADH dehydrogenase subunit 3 [Anthocephalum sp. LRP 10374]